MKLFGPKSISTYLFFICRITTIGSILLLLFILLSFTFDNFEVINGQFKIEVPLFSELYIKGIYNQSILISIYLILIFMSVFFYILSFILNSFKSEKLFTAKVIKHLNLFSILNLVVFPILYFLIHGFIIHGFIIQTPSFRSIHNLFLSLILGVFVLFISEIFKRGLKVQQENDLTI